MIGLFAYLAVKLEDNHFAIKTFFLLLSLLFVLIGLFLLRGIAQENYSTGIASMMDTMYIVYIFLFSFFAFFFILNTFLHVLNISFTARRQNAEE